MLRFLILLIMFLLNIDSASLAQKNQFADGTLISKWHLESKKITLRTLGKKYIITNYGVLNDSSLIQTKAIQAVIDLASKKGGVVIIPNGTFLTGALFFKPKTHLYLDKDAKLKGSDEINDYPILPSRMEGQNLDYFSALINADRVDGFTISGKGTIDGNGQKYWAAFWQRRKENPNCTNLEVSRPRLVFVQHSANVQFQDVRFQNSGFWTTHIYKCENVKLLNLKISSPHTILKAPSTDAIDIDACKNVLIKDCYMSVNDDAIALKGGKGPFADTDSNNGPNENILIEDCKFGFCHSALTCGSEAINIKNVLMRNCEVDSAMRVLWLKMRPDTPQNYQNIGIENIKGKVHSLLYVKPWTQFFDLKGRKDQPESNCDNISLKNINMECDIFFDVAINNNNKLSNFSFENLNISTKNSKFDTNIISGVNVKNCTINGQTISK